MGGTRWWVSSTGSAGGTYPTGAVSRMVGVDAVTFAELVEREAGEYGGHVVIQSDNYLVAVHRCETNENNTVITEIMELSESGKNAYKLLMSAYQRGRENASR